MSEGVYIFYHPEGYAKVGQSKNPEERFDAFQRGSPYELEYWKHVYTFYGGSSIETTIHKRLFDYHVRGEWFEIGKGELLAILEDVVSEEENALAIEDAHHTADRVVPNSVVPKGHKLREEREEFKRRYGIK